MKIKIHNLIWDVVMHPKKSKKMHPKKNRFYYGLTEFDIGVISICEGLSQPLARSTVIHELIHAFIFSYGYDVQSEEAMCDFFGTHGDEIIHLADLIMKEVVLNVDHGRD